MTAYSQRVHHRGYVHAPVQYAYLDTDAYVDSRMKNIGKEGMYFETENPVSPDSGIHIVMTNYPVVAAAPHTYRNYTATVKWCASAPSPGASLFGVGVHFISRGNIITGDHLDRLVQSCDLCGKMRPFLEMTLTPAAAYICGFCDKHMTALPSGEIRDSIENFMIGNVL